jgi:1-acylglycerone phosphate reductase
LSIRTFLRAIVSISTTHLPFIVPITFHFFDIIFLTMAPKTVLITGCSEGGIGDALAQVFHRKGLRVFATARNLSKVEHLKKMGLDTLPLDVTDAASIKAAVESIKSITGGTLDILVNNSGGGRSSPNILQ